MYVYKLKQSWSEPWLGRVWLKQGCNPFIRSVSYWIADVTTSDV
jgi:hypothetical protein